MVFVGLLLAYALVVVPFTSYLQTRPVEVKLGYLPEAEVLKTLSADHRNLVAQYAVVKVLIYFGTVLQKMQGNVIIPPENYNMFKTMEKAVILDPYNMDAYYFSQAAFTWELGKAKDVNRLLIHGMKFRTWDWYLPFYAGFNSAYFLKDYQLAAHYMKRAAELSGNSLFTTLAARYFYESDQNELGILFLSEMIKGERDKNIRKTYELRKEALLVVSELTSLMKRFEAEMGMRPKSLNDLVLAGYFKKIPKDPYGGEFYLNEEGRIRSTGKLSFMKK
jgi:hypothetical protein